MRDVIVGGLAGFVALVAAAALRPDSSQPVAPTALAQPVIPLRDQPWALSRLQPVVTSPATRPEPVVTRLDVKVPYFSYRDARLDRVLAAIADASGTNVVVRWRALEAAGISADAPVTVDLHDVAARTILDIVLSDTGGGTIALEYRAVDDLVTVSTADDFYRDAVTRVYDVRDLIDAMMPAVIPEGERPETIRTYAIDSVVKLLQETVDPTSWRDAGGTVTGYRIIHGLIVLTAPQRVHAQTADFLWALRQAMMGKQ
jgi:hypothetical protein